MVNESYASLSAARLQVDLSPFEGLHQIRICRQCSNAACVEACGKGAIVRDTNGYLVVDYDLCDDCRECVAACPFDAMFWNPISGKVIKCELCGGDPECVDACPTGALTTRIVRSVSTADV
jgi:Fe-S-cluster-containing dehydrogenase component